MKIFEATIAAGASLSGPVDLQNLTLVGILVPSTWTAAAITFQGSLDGTNWFDVCDSTAEVALSSAAAAVWVLLNPALFVGLPFLKVRSGTKASAVTQVAAAALQLLTREV